MTAQRDSPPRKKREPWHRRSTQSLHAGSWQPGMKKEPAHAASTDQSLRVTKRPEPPAARALPPLTARAQVLLGRERLGVLGAERRAAAVERLAQQRGSAASNSSWLWSSSARLCSDASVCGCASPSAARRPASASR